MAAPLAGYSRGQRRVIRALDREFDSRGLSGRRGRVIRTSGYMTGLVESALRNLRYGDGSSVNWRQETASSYPNVDRMNLRGSVRRYVDEAEAAYRAGITPGQLAQAVQRSAFPGRYAEKRGQALDLLAATRRIDWSGGRPSVSGGGSVTMPTSTRAGVEPGGGGVAALLARLREQERPQVPSAGLAAPSFSARAVLPRGFQAVQGSGPVSRGGPRMSDLLGAVEGLRGAVPPRATVTPGSVRGGAQRGGGRGSGGLAAHADGWYGTKTLAEAGKNVAAAMGVPVSSEKRDRKYTSTGGVSDHWVGNKKAWADDYDTPGIDSATLFRLGRKVAKAYGVRFVPNSYESGGTIRVSGRLYRVQILGGSQVEHGDHLHVGISRLL